jgi:hypothetical protein
MHTPQPCTIERLPRPKKLRRSSGANPPLQPSKGPQFDPLSTQAQTSRMSLNCARQSSYFRAMKLAGPHCNALSSAFFDRWQTIHQLYRLQTHGDDLGDEADDVLGVVGAVGVVGDAAAFVSADLVLVNDPFEGGPGPCSGRWPPPGWAPLVRWCVL